MYSYLFGSSKSVEENKVSDEELKVLETRATIARTPKQILGLDVIVEITPYRCGQSNSCILFNTSSLYNRDISKYNYGQEKMSLMWECEGSAVVFKIPIESGSNDEISLLYIFSKVKETPIFKQIDCYKKPYKYDEIIQEQENAKKELEKPLIDM